MFAIVLPGIILGYALWSWICLERNVYRASRIGVPCIRIPVNGNNVLWMASQSLVWAILDLLPIDWKSYPASIRHSRLGWAFHEKAATHERLGPVFALVSPASINIHFSDPDAIGTIFARRRDFVRPVENYEILKVFGPSISTSDEANWPRHRKAVASPFNESIMSFAWDEAIRQSKEMLFTWLRPNAVENGIPSVQDDTRSLVINILAAIGFRKSFSFIGSADEQEQEIEKGSYRQSLKMVLDNAVLLMLVPYKFMVYPFMPKNLIEIGQAAISFRKHMTQMIEEDTRAFNENRKGSGGIMTSFLHAQNARQSKLDRKALDEDVSSSQTRKGLTAEETLGNIFIINFAGYDTTAGPLVFAMLLLASRPDVQKWISEEIRDVLGDAELEMGSYEALFPKLLRCKAVLYETLRLYPPVMALPKGTAKRSQTLRVEGRDIVMPPKTDVTQSLLACHTMASVWPQPLAWKPSRWIERSEDGETFYKPTKNTYFPFADGPQGCPGRKFAEVGILAIFATIFKDHTVHAKGLSGETASQTQKRVLSTINDCHQPMLLRMKNADAVRLVCVARKS